MESDYLLMASLKIVIADHCAVYADQIFTNYAGESSLTLILGVLYFAIQIYCDFSGYSDMAIGLCKLLGFDLMTNFKTPYFSRNIAEFWKRWHISLSTWFRDYLYIPLGGSRVSELISLRNIMIVFLVSGFWHGANWTFIAWGLIHGLFFIPSFLMKTNKKYTTESNLTIGGRGLDLLKILLTFTCVCFAWIFFRAPTIEVALDYIVRIFTTPFVLNSNYTSGGLTNLLIIFFITEWFVFKREDFMKYIRERNFALRHLSYILLVYLLIKESVDVSESFIYFQF